MSPIYKEQEKGEEIDFRSRPLVFIDLETTGLDFDRHEIIEVACLVVDTKTLKIKKRFHRKVVPEHLETADSSALKLVGFSPKAWKRAQPLKQVIKVLNRLAPGGIFTGWNVSFDRPFLEKSAREKDMILNFDYHWIDVMSLFYEESFSNKDIKRLNLGHVCEVLGIKRKDAHTAMGDVETTLAVYRYLRARTTPAAKSSED